MSSASSGGGSSSSSSEIDLVSDRSESCGIGVGVLWKERGSIWWCDGTGVLTGEYVVAWVVLFHCGAGEEGSRYISGMGRGWGLWFAGLADVGFGAGCRVGYLSRVELLGWVGLGWVGLGWVGLGRWRVVRLCGGGRGTHGGYRCRGWAGFAGTSGEGRGRGY